MLTFNYLKSQWLKTDKYGIFIMGFAVGVFFSTCVILIWGN